MPASLPFKVLPSHVFKIPTPISTPSGHQLHLLPARRWHHCSSQKPAFTLRRLPTPVSQRTYALGTNSIGVLMLDITLQQPSNKDGGRSFRLPHARSATIIAEGRLSRSADCPLLSLSAPTPSVPAMPLAPTLSAS